VWDVGTVTTTTPQTLLLRATVASPAARTNTASISHSDQFDPDPGNNQASATETPQQADLAVRKAVSNPRPNVGDVITYTVIVTNDGPDAATGVTINEPVPAGLDVVSATATAGSYDSITGVWTVGTLAGGASAALTINARVVSPAAQTNTATITHADQFDPDTGNNTASATETTQPGGPTAVTLVSFTAARSRSGVVLRWRTGTEADTLGFHVYRERAGKWVRVDRRLIPSKGSVFGGRYSFLDRRAPRAKVSYRLQAVDRNGSRTWYGAVTVH
jgi:uncharacterized repeat protein (TIGR01451 family)